jgi:hypothetical protein
VQRLQGRVSVGGGGGGAADVRSRGSVLLLTRPEAEEVLRVAGLDGAHGAVLDTHNGAFCVERHCEDVGVWSGGRVLLGW